MGACQACCCAADEERNQMTIEPFNEQLGQQIQRGVS